MIRLISLSEAISILVSADSASKIFSIKSQLSKAVFKPNLVNSLQVFPQKSDYYMPRVASIDISNNEIWLGLANLAIRDKNFNMAATYLNNSYYIDANNFRYYYYLSLVLRAKGDNELAQQSLIRCSRLNSDYAADINPGHSIYEE